MRRSELFALDPCLESHSTYHFGERDLQFRVEDHCDKLSKVLVLDLANGFFL